MHYLIAFDKYKSAIPAEEACDVAEKAILARHPESIITKAPLTDGGEGFVSVIAAATGSKLIKVPVKGPVFDEVMGQLTIVSVEKLPGGALRLLQLGNLKPTDGIAFVEMASASGYAHLRDDQRDPWKTTTFGTGQLIKAAMDKGAGAVVLGIGGSATNDCGAGALEALGVAYYDRELQEIRNVTPEKFNRINTVGSTSHLRDRFPPLRIACDVTNPLLGPQGATAVFGPQKGLKPEDADRMERAMHKMGSRLLGLFGQNPANWDSLMSEPGTGAAGGIGFALHHALPDSMFVEGFPLVAEILNLFENLERADCILTGEGRLDNSSLAGKGPIGLLQAAGADKHLRIFCGSVDQDVVDHLKQKYPLLRIEVISDESIPLEQSLRQTAENLRMAISRCLDASS